MTDPASTLERPARYRWLLAAFTRREIFNRHAGSVSAVAWTLIHPLAQLAIFAVIFTQVFRATVPPEFPGVSYTAFVAVALWPWIMFSESLTRGMQSIGANAGLIRKVAFPHRVLVYAAVLACFTIHAIGFLVVLLVLKATGEPIHLRGIPLAGLLLVPYILLAAGIAAFLAALQTLLKDVEHAVGIVLTVVFYATPILYPASFVPAGLRPYIENQPLGYFAERLRQVLLQGAGLVPGDFVAFLICMATFALGLWIFNRLSPHFEDFL